MSPNVDANERLCAARESTLGAPVADVLHQRLEELCDVVFAAGSPRPTKKRLVSAIILAASTDAEALSAMLARYDAALVRDALVQQSDGDVVELHARRPGPRSRRPRP
jgi:hypothetical protein